ncbi:right-handed parallel beta-helix repeat-containing protein [Sphingobacterium sp.]|uniref:right-handed parallel beta-helix repeat-containing protein n=1 Tax=Sphingobacterium sp. TaxID=341027 RepID=UPI002FDA4B84
MANQLLIKNTMADMRNLCACELTELQDGYYSGIQLLGYYQAGDTPNPINYYLSSDTGNDDGGSLIVLSEIVLKHDFVDQIDARYFGVKSESGFDNSPIFDKLFSKDQEVLLVNYNNEQYEISTWIKPQRSFKGLNRPTIKMISNGGDDPNSIIKIVGYTGDALIIDGFKLVGNFVNGGTDKEWAHGIRILGSKNVTISNNEIEDVYGDNIYIGANNGAQQYSCENVTIINNGFSNPRRCNVSVISASNIFIRNNRFMSHNGYVSSIDLEPNKLAPLDQLENIYIEDNIFNVPQSTFINLVDPITRQHNNIFIRRNIGEANFFLRVTGGGNGKFNHIQVSENNFKGGGRMFLISANAVDLTILNNKDFATGAEGWAINGQINPLIQGNELSAILRTGIIFTDSTQVDISNNIFRDFYRAIVFKGLSGSSANNKINNNYFLNNSVGLRFETKVGITSLASNFISSSTYNFQITSAGNDSDIRISTSNILLGVNFNGSQYLLKQYNPNGREDNWATNIPVKGYFFAGTKIYNSSINEHSQVVGWICIQEGIATNILWKANTEYSIGTLIQSGNNVYVVKTAGITSYTPPTDSTPSMEIVDGTVVWNYVGSLALFKPFGNISSDLNKITMGTTQQRPSVTTIGYSYYDTSLDIFVWWNGESWDKGSRSATLNTEGNMKQSVPIADVTLNDAVNLETALILVNELKQKLNNKLSADRNSGQQAI